MCNHSAWSGESTDPCGAGPKSGWCLWAGLEKGGETRAEEGITDIATTVATGTVTDLGTDTTTDPSTDQTLA